MIVEKHLRKECDKISAIADSLGMDWHPIRFETVSRNLMQKIATYGLPFRMKHYKYAMSWYRNKKMGEMGGFAYETIIHGNPCFAYMSNENTKILNELIIAHCIGHSHVFKNNYHWKVVPTSIIEMARTNLGIAEDYKARYGNEVVTDFLTSAFALEDNLDWNYYVKHGETFPPYPKPSKVLVHEGINDHFELKEPVLPYQKEINTNFPPYPEKDLLWFLATQSPRMEDWQRELLLAVRQEAYFFYPFVMTKILHEGFASMAHIKIMDLYLKDSKDVFDFALLNAGVVNPNWAPSGNPDMPAATLTHNPYWIGYNILKDIEARWDDYFNKGLPTPETDEYPSCDRFRLKDKNGNIVKSKITGWQKVLEVIKEEDDMSLFRNYLTSKLMKELNLAVFKEDKFSFTVKTKSNPHEFNEAMNMLKAERYTPQIAVTQVTNKGMLVLDHLDIDSVPGYEILLKDAKQVLLHLYNLWGSPVMLRTKINGVMSAILAKRNEGKVQVFLADANDKTKKMEEI